LFNQRFETPMTDMDRKDDTFDDDQPICELLDAAASGSTQSRQAAMDDALLDAEAEKLKRQQFMQLHSGQLERMGLPKHLWNVLFDKISRQQLDAGESFQLCYVEGDDEEADADEAPPQDPSDTPPAFQLICNVEQGLKAAEVCDLLE